MTWFYIHRRDTGRMVSETSERPTALRAGLAVTEKATRNGGEEMMWDEQLRDFVPRPPPVLVDRLDDFHALLAPLNARLNAGQRRAVNTILARLLGSFRFRRENDHVDLP